MADEPSLLHFQRELMERLSNARAHPGALGHVGFESANQPCLLALSDVRAIVMATDFARVPLSDASFRGLINFQGELVGVVDPASLLRQAPVVSEIGTKSAVVVMHGKFGLNIGILVGRLVGLRDCQKWARSSSGNAPQWVQSELADEQGVRWRLLDVPALLEALHVREYAPAA